MDQIKITTLGLALAAAFGLSNGAQAQTSNVTFGTTRPIAAQSGDASGAVFKAPQFGPAPAVITQPVADETPSSTVQGPALAIFSSVQKEPSSIVSVSYDEVEEYAPVVLLETEDAPQTTFAPVAQDVANDAAQAAPSPSPAKKSKPEYVLSDPFARPRPARPPKEPKEDSAMTKALEKGAADGVFTRNGKHVYTFEPPTTLSVLKSKPTPNVQSASQNVLNAVYPTQTQVSRYPSSTPQAPNAAPGAQPSVPQVNAQPLPTASAAPQATDPQWTTTYPSPAQPQPAAPQATTYPSPAQPQPAAQPQIDYALNYSQPSPQEPAPAAQPESQVAPASENAPQAQPQIVREYAPMPAQGAYARFTNAQPTYVQTPEAYPYVDQASSPYVAYPCASTCSSGFFGAGEWLSWRTERANNAFAQVGNDEQTLSPNGSGFRATAGFRGVRGWDVSWTYTYFDADKSQSANGDDVRGVGPFGRFLADSATANADVNLQVHDFEIGRWNANCNSSLAFRPFVGFRWTQLDESLDRQYANVAENVTGAYYSSSKLSAYGLRMGAEARIPLFGALAGYAKGAGTVAVGDVKTNYLASVDGEMWDAFSAKKTYFTPSVEAALGLSWKRGGFEARGGYEFNDWFNASNASGINDDFIAHGWFAGVSWNR